MTFLLCGYSKLMLNKVMKLDWPFFRKGIGTDAPGDSFNLPFLYIRCCNENIGLAQTRQ